MNYKDLEKEFDKWFAKTMSDCAMYKFPESGIEGLLKGDIGEFSGFIFLKQRFEAFYKAKINLVIDDMIGKEKKPKNIAETTLPSFYGRGYNQKRAELKEYKKKFNL